MLSIRPTVKAKGPYGAIE